MERNKVEVGGDCLPYYLPLVACCRFCPTKPMGILRRRHAPQCYYCLTPCAEGTTAASSRWCCPACGCWNVRDAKGSIVSEHPAMRDSELNRKSFALRGEWERRWNSSLHADDSPARYVTAAKLVARVAVLSRLPDQPDSGHESPQQLSARGIRVLRGRSAADLRTRRIPCSPSSCQTTLRLCMRGTRRCVPSASPEWTRRCAGQTRRRRQRRGAEPC